MTWEPGQPHAKPDPNRCPYCLADGEFAEHARRPTWQPVTLRYEGHAVVALEVDEYREFEWGDDVDETSYECRGCGAEWNTLGELAYDQRVRQAFEDHRDYSESLLDACDPDNEVAQATYESSADAWRRAIEIISGNGEA